MGRYALRSLQALGVAVTYLFAFILPLVSPGHDFLYHLRRAPSHVFVPVFLDVLIGTVALFTVLTLAARWQRFGPALALCLLVSLPWTLYRGGVAAADWNLPRWTGAAIASVTLLACIAAILIPASSPLLLAAHHFAETIFVFCGLSALVILAQLAYSDFSVRDIGTDPPLHQSATTATEHPHPRILWILLDELSFDQVYEHRYPGLALPAFDDLARQSTVFTHAIAAGIATQNVVPALITGTPTDGIRISRSGNLLAQHDPEDDRWRPFHPADTIFHEALQHGYSTSIVGWYNPYCRILAPVLDHCFWRYNSERAFYMQPDVSIARNTARPALLLRDILLHLLHRTPRLDPEPDASLASFRDLDAAATRALADPSQNMLFFHMPVPHPPAFFDRRTRTFRTTGGSYLDNLALADLWLGHIKEQLVRQGEWDADTVVVMGDHSWRTQLIWGHSPFWTAEDLRASRGLQFDDRPAYIVKLPAQHTPARIDTPFQATRTRSLFDQLLDGTLHTPAELQAWAASGS